MGVRRGTIVFLSAYALLCPACDRGGIPREVMDKVRQAHDRMLTVGFGGSRVDPRAMERRGLDAAFFVVTVPSGEATSELRAEDLEAVFRAIDGIRRVTEVEAAPIGLGLSPSDAYRNEKAGRRTAFIAMGDAGIVGTDLSVVAALYERGVRMLTLCGGRDNAVCDSSLDTFDPGDRGLSDFGRKLIAECNRIGMILDLAGASERSFFEVLDASRSPVIVSRAVPRTAGRLAGGLTDEMVRALAGKGGLALAPSGPEIAGDIGRLLALAGQEAVGIAADAGRGSGDHTEITLELFRRAYTESSVEAFWGGNIMGLFERVAARAGRN